jgi:hypothetical protein
MQYIKSSISWDFTFSPNTLSQISLLNLFIYFYTPLLDMPRHYHKYCERYIFNACKYLRETGWGGMD